MRIELRVYDDISSATRFKPVRLKIVKTDNGYITNPYTETIKQKDNLFIVENRLEDNEVLFGRFDSDQDCIKFLERLENKENILETFFVNTLQKGVLIRTYTNIKDAYKNRFFYVVKTKKNRYKLTQSRLVSYTGKTVHMEEPLVSGEIVKKSRDRSDCIRYIKSVS